MPIKITDLTYIYSKGTPFAKTALNKVCLEIDDGDFLGVIGHTGSGKSTLMSHLNALTEIQYGKIEIDGFTLEGNNGRKPKRKQRREYKNLRAHVGMVFQYPEYQLFDETVSKDIAFGAKNLGIKGDELTERVKNAIQMVGLNYDEVAERSPFDLSGGQKRRVAIAGVLAMQPEILVLDEPTAGLDPRGKREILDLITKIKQTLCPTVIMISHNMDEVAKYCNKIAVMAEGELKLVSTPAELFANAELLDSLNIEMPEVAKLAALLRAEGLNIPSGILTEDELTEAILKAKGVAL